MLLFGLQCLLVIAAVQSVTEEKGRGGNCCGKEKPRGSPSPPKCCPSTQPKALTALFQDRFAQNEYKRARDLTGAIFVAEVTNTGCQNGSCCRLALSWTEWITELSQFGPVDYNYFADKPDCGCGGGCGCGCPGEPQPDVNGQVTIEATQIQSNDHINIASRIIYTWTKVIGEPCAWELTGISQTNYKCQNEFVPKLPLCTNPACNPPIQ